MNKEITYPQYRKYPNNRVFFKIISEKDWEEIQILGVHHSIHYFTAKILPFRNFIEDMTFDYERNWVKIEEEEYESIKSKVI